MTGPECPDCADMDSDADPPPPDFTATTLPGIIDDKEDPEGAWHTSHKTRAKSRVRLHKKKLIRLLWSGFCGWWWWWGWGW